MNSAFDVIIIGGGITGCCTAYELARRGVRTALLEKDTPGAGSTGKSSAIIRQHYSNELTARMAHYGLQAFENASEELGEDCGYVRAGFIAVVSAQDVGGLESNVALQSRVGIRAELVGVDALRKIMPDLETSDLVSAAYEPDAGYADPHLAVNAYARAAQRAGASIFLNTEAKEIRFSGDRVIGVSTADESLDAPAVINCAGPWSPRIARMAGVEVPIHACRAQVAFLRRPTGHEAPHPVVVDFIHASYFRPETGQITLAGLIDPSEGEAVIDPDAYNELQDDDFVLDVGARLLRRFPIMADSQCTGGYAAPYAVTPDWHPIIDELPADSGCFICAGFSGHGFKLGPAVGRTAADLVTRQSDPLFDPHLFRFSRFRENDLVQGQYDYSIAG